MGGQDVILDISDYVDPVKLVPRDKKKGRKGRAKKIVDESKEIDENSPFPNALTVEVILDEEPMSSETRSHEKKVDAATDPKYIVSKGGSVKVGGVSDDESETHGTRDGSAAKEAGVDMELGAETFTVAEKDEEDGENDQSSYLDLNDLSNENIFGEIEETDVLVAKDIDQTISPDYESNTRLFNTILSQFRRNPVLANIKSIQLQLGQDQVVEPVAVRRLIAQVQNVIEVHEKYTSTSTPILDRFFDKKNSRLSSSLFKPLIYDSQTIYLPHVSANTENDHTIRYEQRSEILNDLLENFKHPPIHRGKKPYNSSVLYARNGYVKKENTHFEDFEAQTPIRNFTKRPDGSVSPGYTQIFSTESDAQRCVSSARSERYLDLVSTFNAYRVSENIDIETLEAGDAEFAVQERAVSYPVIQPQYDEDTDSLVLSEVIPGESISIIGFVVDRNRRLNLQKAIHVGYDPQRIQQLSVSPNDQFIILCPDNLADILKILAPPPAEILTRQSANFRRCFNYESAEAILLPFMLDLYSVDSQTVSGIRSRITKNIIDLIDHVNDLRLRNAKKAKAGIRTSKETQLEFFYVIPDLVVETFESENLRGDDDMELLGKMKTMEGAEELYCLAIGMKYVEDPHEIQDELVRLEKAVKTSRVPDETHRFSYDDVMRFLNDPAKAQKMQGEIPCLMSVRKRISYLQNLSIDIERFGESKKLVGDLKERIAFMGRRRRHGRIQNSSSSEFITVEDFSLSLNEESDEIENDETENGAGSNKYVYDYSSNVLPTYFLSPDLQNKLTADSSVRLQLHFTAKPLLLIARQLNTMLHPNKLGCSMSIEEIKTMVYDISEMCDESFSYFQRRSFVQELVMSNGMAKQEALAEWRNIVGGELDVKTQKRVSVILARLILQLELQRPIHSFRKIFPIGGQKTIGKDSQSTFESYTPDNKVRYIVTVAAQTADLGKEGRLMNDYQASDLKNIIAYTTSYYDRFINKPSLSAMKMVADKADEIQTTLLSEKKKDQIPHGYTLVQSEDTLKALLDRLETNNVSLQSLMHRINTHGNQNFEESSLIRGALRKKINFLVISHLASIQRHITQIDESDLNLMAKSAYNPDKYGDEKSTACQPGEVCIQTTFVNLHDIRPDIRDDLYDSENALRSMKMRLHLVRFPRRFSTPTYDFHPSVQKSTRSRLVMLERKSPKQPPTKNAKPPADVSLLDALVELLASKTGKDEQWRITFSAKFSDLGKMTKVNQSLPAARPSDIDAIFSSGFDLIKHFYRILRRDICLLSHHLYVTVNSYEMVKEMVNGADVESPSGSSNQPGDTMQVVTARGTIYQMKKLSQLESRVYVDDNRPEWDVLYYNREDVYLTKYIGLAGLLEGYINADKLSSVSDIIPEKSMESYSKAHELLVSAFAAELKNCCEYVLQQNPEAIDIANFSIDFMERCFKQQHDMETSARKLEDMQNRLYEKYLKEMTEQSKERSQELWTFRKVGINVSYMDDIPYDDQSAWDTIDVSDDIDTGSEINQDDVDYENSREDFDMVDDENEMNLFNDDE